MQESLPDPSQPSHEHDQEQPYEELRALRQQHEAMGQRLNTLERQLGIKPARTSKGAGGAVADKPALKLPANFEQLIGLQGFSWLGILALVTGLGLFIRYAYVEGWLGPLAILLGGVVVGAAMIGTGEWIARREHYRTWAHALMGGGIAVLYFLVYASYHFEYFRAVTHLNQMTDVLLLMAVVGLAIFLALRRQSQSLASRAFVLGFVTSLLSQQLVSLTLMYNLILSIGLVGVVAVARWQGLALVGIVGSYVLHGVWLAANPDSGALGLGVMLVYSGLYGLVADRLESSAAETPELHVSPAVSTSVATSRPKTGSLGSYAFWQSSAALGLMNLAGFAGIMLMLLIFGQALPLWQHWGASVLWLGVGLVFQSRLLALPASRTQAWQGVFFAHWVLAIVFSDLALQAQTAPAHSRSGMLAVFAVCAAGWAHLLRQRDATLLRQLCHWLTAGCLAGLIALEAPALGISLFWAAEAAVLLWLGQTRKHLVPPALVLVMVSMLELIAHSMPGAYPAGGMSALIYHGLTVAVLLGVAWGSETVEHERAQDQQLLRNGLNWPASIALTCWLAWALPNTGLSMGWTVAGCLLVIAGFVLKHQLLRLQGLVLLLLTGAKVFLVDMRELSMGWRILSLMVLGALLLGIALIYTRRQHTESLNKTDSEPSASQESVDSPST